MKANIRISLILLILSLTARGAFAQLDSSVLKARNAIDHISERSLSKLSRRYKKMGDALSENNDKAINLMEKKELRLLKKMNGTDSSAVAAAYRKTKEKYERLRKQLSKPPTNISQYVPGLDSMQTLFKFLDGKGASIPGIPADKIAAIKALGSQFTTIQNSLQHTSDIQDFLKERRQMLSDELSKLGMSSQLASINKQVYYYQAQVNEYKQLLNDPGKLQDRMLNLVRNTGAFKDFMTKNSLFAQLFLLPGSGPAIALPGLQTISGVQQQMGANLAGSTGIDPSAMVQQQAQAAQAELNKLKDRINKLGGSGSDEPMPDFKPNNQKTKSFWKRVELGMNIQSQKQNSLLPVTSDIALTAGYKLNDKSTIGFGAGYKLGWGKDISHIQFSSQGISLRTFIDVKLKGSWWISGGYEGNFQQEFAKIEQLKNINAWQRSGLIGITKKYKIGKKNGNLQLLWDFLSYEQVPRTQALKFRIGYTL